jgi:soluble lytic murein transglycosylase-like protein
MRFIAIFVSLAAFVSLAPAAFAGEYVVLASGARMHVDRHETTHESTGDKIRLYMGDSFAEMGASQVQRFEADDYTPPPPPAPVVEPVPVVAVEAKPALTPVELADQAADKYGLPRWLVRSVMRAESGFQPQVVSPKGAIGLMQLMPGTAQTLGADPRDPAQNADAGARYLRDLLQIYDGALWHALAAYNAGPGAVAKYKGLPPYAETLRYISRIDQDRKKATGQ